MLRYYRYRVARLMRRYFRAVIFGAIVALALFRMSGQQSREQARYSRVKMSRIFDGLDDGGKLEKYTEHDATSPTVHLIIASTVGEDISWTSAVRIPNLQVIHYIADDPTAMYHPPTNRGHEAMIYHTYLYDFYDHLPDIVIMTHAQDVSWHMDSLLSYSLTFALSHLDLDEVEARGYTNLHVGWENACPAWINTTVTELNPLKWEESFMRDAFLENFGSTSESIDQAPEILAQPCCSQFAITRAVIQAVPREKYGHFIRWLETASLDDYILGRAWEHMFQYLFTQKPIDCPVEWKAYCRMYHICFEGREDYEAYLKLYRARVALIDNWDVGVVKGAWNWLSGSGRKNLEAEIGALTTTMNNMKHSALVRGRIESSRRDSIESLYIEEWA